MWARWYADGGGTIGRRSHCAYCDRCFASSGTTIYFAADHAFCRLECRQSFCARRDGHSADLLSTAKSEFENSLSGSSSLGRSKSGSSLARSRSNLKELLVDSTDDFPVLCAPAALSPQISCFREQNTSSKSAFVQSVGLFLVLLMLFIAPRFLSVFCFAGWIAMEARAWLFLSTSVPGGGADHRDDHDQVLSV